MHGVLNVSTLNWAYFALSLLIIVLACTQMWRNSQQKKDGHTKYKRRKKSDLNGIQAIVNYLWRKEYKLLILVVTLIISWFVLFADNIFKIDNIPAKDELSSLLLLVTGAVIFWYTRETYDQKNILQDQKTILKDQKAVQQSQFDFENRPYLRLQWSKSGNEVLQIVNDGKGLARDVCFEPIDVEKGVPFAPLRRPVIAAGQYTTISTHELQEGASKTQLNSHAEYVYNVKWRLDDFLKEGKFGTLHITYLDLRDQVYDAFFVPDERYNDRFNIESQDKRG